MPRTCLNSLEWFINFPKLTKETRGYFVSNEKKSDLALKKLLKELEVIDFTQVENLKNTKSELAKKYYANQLDDKRGDELNQKLVREFESQNPALCIELKKVNESINLLPDQVWNNIRSSMKRNRRSLVYKKADINIEQLIAVEKKLDIKPNNDLNTTQKIRNIFDLLLDDNIVIVDDEFELA